MTEVDTNNLKIFTIDEANSLIPWLNYEFSLIFFHFYDFEKAASNLLNMGIEPSFEMTKISREDSPIIKTYKKQLKQALKKIFSHYTKIKEKGIIIQEVSSGIVSFYTYFGEHPVFITWQYGDSEVRWWHEIYEDTKDRKPLPRTGSIHSIFN